MFDPKMLETVDHRGGHWQIQRFRDARPGLFEYAVQAGFVAAADGGREIDAQWLRRTGDGDQFRKVSPRSRGEDGSLAIGWERVAPCFRRGEVIRLVDQPDTTMGDSGMRVAQNHPFDARNTLLRLEDQAYMNGWDRYRYAVAACKDQYRRLDPPRYEPVPGTIWHAGAGGSSYTFVVLSDEGCGISHADDERCKTVLFSDGSRGFWAFSSPPREEYRGGLTDEQLAEARAFAENADGATDDLVDSATYAIDELLGLASVTRQGVTVELDPMPALLARLDTIIELLSDGEVVTAPEPVAGKFRVTRLEDGKTIMGDAEVWSGVTRPLSITFEDVKIDEHTYELPFGRPQPEPAAPTAVRPGQLWGFATDSRLRVRWVEAGNAFLVEERDDGAPPEPWCLSTEFILKPSSGYRLLEDVPAGTFYIGSFTADEIRSLASVDLP